MRILIADDEPINRFLLLHMLEEEGYANCYEAQDGREAIELANRISPDLLLLDVDMPEVNGYEVAKQLKSKSSVYLPIIFITASSDRESLLKCLEAGGDDFAVKPFDRSILSAKINAHMRSRKMSLHIEEQNKALSDFRREVDLEHAMVEHMYNHALQNPEAVLRHFDVLQKPAKTFNGDLFLVHPHPNGGLYFFIGDFTGHGLASTVGALPVSKTFTAMAAKGLSLIEIAQALNEMLYSFLPVDRFCAATLGHINESGTRAMVWQGGMPDFFVQSKYSDTNYRVESKHMSLGILPPEDFETDCIMLDLEEGDRLTFLTDGIVEATPEKAFTEEASANMLGEETLKQWLDEKSDVTAQALYQRAQTQLGRTQFDDDVTIVRFQSEPLFDLKIPNTQISVPFLFSVSLGPDELRTESSLEQVFQIINNQPGLAAVRADLFTVLSEMYTNALEHGILGLESDLKESPDGFMEYYELREARLQNLTEGFIRIDVNLYPKEQRIAVAVNDSGDGFDYQALRENKDSASSGRGIALLKEICDDLWFEGVGNRIVVELNI